MTRPPVPSGPYLVAGAGRAGRAAAERLASWAGADAVRVWDEHAHPEGPEAAVLDGLGIELLVGDHATALGSGERPGCIVKSPGIAMSHPLVASAGGQGVTVLDELELGWRLCTAPVIGVTGTNGKSTVAHLVHRAVLAAGEAAVKAGNVEDGPPLSAVEEADSGWVVCEASSYQLEGCPNLLPEVGVLTNLTHDHLNRHGTMGRYGEAKRRLFVRGERAVGLAVLNCGDPLGRRLADEVCERGGEVRSFGATAACAYRVRETRWDLERGRAEIETPDGPVTIESALPGPHNAANLAAALAIADGLGLERGPTIEALSTAPSLAGRFERIDAGQPFDAVVDFAHTPDAVEHVLTTVRAILRRRQAGRLLALVSASGPPADDLAKRPKIGRIARALSDELVITTSNPRGEPAESLVAGLADGARSVREAPVHVEHDRRRAIERLVSLARPDDVVVITGRGALQTIQERRGDPGRPFDDREVLRECLVAHAGAA